MSVEILEKIIQASILSFAGKTTEEISCAQSFLEQAGNIYFEAANEFESFSLCILSGFKNNLVKPGNLLD